MNHPTPDQWVSFIYDEDVETLHREIQTHVRDCSSCAVKLAHLRAGMQQLDEWELPRRRIAQARPFLQWAAAAAVLFAIGIGLGRWSAPDTKIIRADMQREMDAKLATLRADTQEWIAAVNRDQEQKREVDIGNLQFALKQAETRRISEASRLRHDLDTVAVFADVRLSLAQEQLNELAASTQVATPIPVGDH